MNAAGTSKQPQGVPTYEDLMLPLLLGAQDGESHRVRDLAGKVADYFSLPEQLRDETLPDGRNRLIHRMEWARTYLKKAGLVDYPGRGLFRITQRGQSVLREKPTRIDSRFLRRYPEFVQFKSSASQEGEASSSTGAQPVDPEEALENGYQALREEVESELLQKLKAASPSFFESAVVDLLLKMGYGGSRKEAGRAIGRAGDEGIDGVIDEDALGLDVVYIQAKRWADKPVGRQEIQQFVGALQGKRARKGIFITTSVFAQTARDYVRTIENRVVLIDGSALASLLFDYGIGVSEAKRYTVKRIDSDYFEE